MWGILEMTPVKRELQLQKQFGSINVTLHIQALKLPESGEGNRNLDPGGTESLQQNQPKEVHTKTYN